MNFIEFNKITTNNLKNISVKIPEKKLTCITGCSGSGKSTLAFDSIHAVCDSRFSMLKERQDKQYNFKIEQYNKLLVSVAIKQLNYNNNPRSTIATYFGIDNHFKNLFAIHNNTNSNVFSFNTKKSVCTKCNGLGYEYIADKSLIVDTTSLISEVPLMPFRELDKDFNKKLFKVVCEEYNIPENSTFKDLKPEYQEFLLFGASEQSFKINFTQSNRKRVKTQKYIGAMNVVNQNILKEIKYRKYCKKIKCSKCDGTRFSKNVLKFKLFGKNIGELYNMELVELKVWVQENKLNFKLEHYVELMIEFIDSLIEFGLGYVSLNRTISTLSGGEFQRLRISQTVNSAFENLLLVIDEPTSSLHILEKENIVNKVQKLKEKNTVLIVEHDSEVVKIADYVITLGPCGGKNGGYIVENDKKTDVDIIKKEVDIKNYIKISSKDQVHNVKPFELSFPCNSFVGVCGKSGSGKTTFAKEILNKYIDNYIYISQKPIRGNAYSSIASYIGLSDKIRRVFAVENKVSESIFSNHFAAKGCCPICKGTGKISYNHYDNSYDYVCSECNGSKFSKEALEYKYKGFNISEVLKLECAELLNVFEDDNILYKLNILAQLGLEYVSLGQSIGTLSGGESQKVKLAKLINKKLKDKIIVLDEPFQGLDSNNISRIYEFLSNVLDNGNTVIIIEHNLKALSLMNYIIEFGKGSGDLGGDIIFSGNYNEIINDEKSIIGKYLKIIK